MTADEAFALAEEWASGARSHTNMMQAVEDHPSRRQQTLLAVVQADAAEAQKWAALGVALAQKEAIHDAP